MRTLRLGFLHTVKRAVYLLLNNITLLYCPLLIEDTVMSVILPKTCNSE